MRVPHSDDYAKLFVQPGAIRSTSTNAGPSAYTTQAHAAPSNNEYAHLPLVQREILLFMRSEPSNDEGIHVAKIARSVGGGDAAAIRQGAYYVFLNIK